MSRPLRIEYPDAWYHVMNRGRRSEKIFLNRKDYQLFTELMIEACELWDVNISAFSLMPNHYHLLVNTPNGNLSRFMRHINGVYTQRFNKNHKLEGQLFKGRFKSILVDGDNYLIQLVGYIHRNPLRAKIVENIDCFEWSSHQGYISGSKDWDWLYKDFILSILSGNKNNWIKEYRNFINESDKKEILKLLDRVKWPSFFGSDDFVFTIKEKFYNQKKDKEVPESYNLSPDINHINEVVCEYYNINIETLCKSKRRTFNEPRNIAIYLSRYFRNDTLEQLGKDFLLNNHSSVSSALSITKELMQKDPKLKQRVKEIEELCLKRQAKT